MFCCERTIWVKLFDGVIYLVRKIKMSKIVRTQPEGIDAAQAV